MHRYHAALALSAIDISTIPGLWTVIAVLGIAICVGITLFLIAFLLLEL